MPGARRDSVAFTVVVTVLVCLGALPDPAPHRRSPAPPRRCCWRPCWPRCRWARWWPATCGWTATSRSPSGCSPSACCGAAFVATAPRCSCRASAAVVVGFTDAAVAGGRRAGHRGGQQGALPAAAAVVAPRRARRHPRRHRLRRHGRHRLRLHREHPLPRRGLQRHRRHGPRRHRRGHRRSSCVRCLFSPFAHPLFTDVHRHRRRHRGRQPQPGRPHPGAAGSGTCSPWSPTRIWNASTLYGFAGFVGVYVVLMVPAFVGLVGARGLGAPLRAADADRRRSPTPPSAG